MLFVSKLIYSHFICSQIKGWIILAQNQILLSLFLKTTLFKSRCVFGIGAIDQREIFDFNFPVTLRSAAAAIYLFSSDLLTTNKRKLASTSRDWWLEKFLKG